MHSKHPSSALRNAVKAVGFDTKGSSWLSVSGGHSNQVWRIICDGKRLVVKSFPTDWNNPLFENSAHLEIWSLQNLATLHIAPVYQGSGTANGIPFVVYEHLDTVGETIAPEDVGVVLRQLHQSTAKLNTAFRNVPQLQNPVRRMLNLNLDIPASVSRILDVNQDAFETVPRRSLLHGDPTMSNFVLSRHGLKLIDWQCPALGDPIWDLAVFLSPAMRVAYRQKIVTEQDIDACLLGYGDDEIANSFRKHRSLFAAIFATYCIWQCQQGKLQYSSALDAELEVLDKAKD